MNDQMTHLHFLVQLTRIEPDLSSGCAGDGGENGVNLEQQPSANGNNSIVQDSDDVIDRPSDGGLESSQSPQRNEDAPSSGDDDMAEDGEWDLDPALAGFRFCTEEAVRFLVEEEGFAVDDPVVLQLQRHLEAQRSRLQDRCQRVQPSLLQLANRDGDDSGVSGALLQFQVTPGEEPSLSETDQGFADMSSDVVTSP